MEMDACCGELDGEAAPLAQGTVYPDLSFVSVDHSFHIAHAQPKAFYIVQVAGMGTEEFFEDTLQRLFAHAYTIILNADH